MSQLIGFRDGFTTSRLGIMGETRLRYVCVSPPLVERVFHHFARAEFQITDTNNTAFYSNINVLTDLRAI